MPPTHLLVTAPGLRVRRIPRIERDEARAGGTRWIVVATLLLAIAAALGYLRTWPPLATVMSASMAPTINTGDVVVLKRLDAPAATGEVVMVRVPDEARARFGYPPVVIHRVVAIAPDGTVTTKGDAKEEIDPFTVPQSAITTRVLTHVPAAGQAFGFLSSTLGLLWLGGGAALFFGLPLLERYRDGQRRLTEERDERELVMEELRARVELLPGQIERAVAAAVAAMPAAPRATPGRGEVAGGAGAAECHVAPGGGVARRSEVAGGAVAASALAAPALVAPPALPARIVSAREVAALVLARRTPPPAPPAPPVPASRFPAAARAVLTGPAWPAPTARPATRRPGVLCAVGGP